MLFCKIENNNTLNIQNELDLHKAIVKFLKTTDLLFTCPLPCDLDTDEKRIMSSLKGYTKGTPDIFIFNKNNSYNGLAIELKTPKGYGTISKSQYAFIENLSCECDYFVLVSNDFSTIIECIVKYSHGIL